MSIGKMEKFYDIDERIKIKRTEPQRGGMSIEKGNNKKIPKPRRGGMLIGDMSIENAK